MKQQVLISALLWAVVSISWSVAEAAAVLVGKVDVQKVLTTVEQGKRVRDKLKKDFDKKQKQLKKGEDRIRKMQQELQKQSLVMNQKTKAKKEREIQEEILKLQKLTMDFQQEIQRREQKLKVPLLENVRTVVDEVSKKAGVDLTVETSTAPIMYAKKSKDITGMVIKAYNSKYK